MKGYRLAICDKDQIFVNYLSDEINNSINNEITLAAFTNLGSVSKYLETNDINLIITDEIPEEIEKKDEKLYYKGVRCIYFSADRHLEDDNSIFKYQSVRELYGAFRSKLNLANSFPNKFRHLDCVFSPVARSGKTLLSKALAADDAAGRGLRVVMEDYPEKILDGESSELLYYVKEKSPDFSSQLKRLMRSREGFQEVTLSGIYLDSRDVQKSDLEWLTERIRESGEFSDIVFDIGSAGLASYEILEVFDRIFMPVVNDEISKKKTEVFKQLLRDMNLREILYKIREVEVPYTDYRSEQMIKTVFKVKSE